jgi:SAM-dependent methyltransferase
MDALEEARMDKYTQSNRELWEEWTLIHERSSFYDVEGFKAGRCALRPIELEALGDVTGKSLLHLQCHFGMGTLSWGRRGARVTGVDFSEKAIALARALSQELAIPAEFVLADIAELPTVLQGEFDIVFTSYGVLTWLPDIVRWGRVVAHFLKPGGTFFIAEFHPIVWVFDEEASHLRVRYPYFHQSLPLAFPIVGSYADRNARVSKTVEYGWNHPLSDIINALITAGLYIEALHEYPYAYYAMMPSLMESNEAREWRLREHSEGIPLMFSIKATKAPGG